MPPIYTWVFSVLSGVTVAALVAVARTSWQRRNIPAGLSRSVNRRRYILTILRNSKNPQITNLDIFTPNLTPARGNSLFAEMQAAWADIHQRGQVRVVAGTSQQSLTAGAELVERGVEVRVPRVLASEDVSYHIFRGKDSSSIVVNYRDAGKHYPTRLGGPSLTEVFRSNFEKIWESSAPYESVIAEKILENTTHSTTSAQIVERITETRSIYYLEPAAERAIVTHVAFRRESPVIFVIGLPGAGKSIVRRELAHLLRRLRFQTEELTDYVYAFRDFVHGAILLDDTRGKGFLPSPGGAFRVADEVHLKPALKSLAEQVWSGKSATKITLVEFARADMLDALREFGDDILSRAKIIHVHAEPEARERRLKTRATPPMIMVDQLSINISVSDDHRLPTTAAGTLYDHEGLDELLNYKALNGRIFQIDNNIDAGVTVVRERLAPFINGVVEDYERGSS